MRQSSASLEERVLELETRVDVLESLLAERYPETPAPAPSSSKGLVPKRLSIYLHNPYKENNIIDVPFVKRVSDFDKNHTYTFDPKMADVALYYMYVSGGRPDLTAARQIIENDGFSTRVMIFAIASLSQTFVESADLLPGTKIFFFLLYDDWAMKKFERPGSKRRIEQDTVLRKAIDYLTE
jgi:hypothetical protein